MSLITHKTSHGNLKLIDLRRDVNISRLRPDFNRLSVDPYVKEGYRRKHILRIKRTEHGYQKMPLAPLYQSVDVNPTHGNIHRQYKEYIPVDPSTLKLVVDQFIKHGNVPVNSVILLQAQRITCSVYGDGLPSVENWHRDGVNRIGIVCIDRYKVKGGINEFRLNTDYADMVHLELLPGQMVVFDDDMVQHRVTPISFLPDADENDLDIGHRDVLLMAF